jgi:hypothetical protein
VPLQDTEFMEHLMPRTTANFGVFKQLFCYWQNVMLGLKESPAAVPLSKRGLWIMYFQPQHRSWSFGVGNNVTPKRTFY